MIIHWAWSQLLVGSLFCCLPALNDHSFIRIIFAFWFIFYILLLPIQPRVEPLLSKVFSMGSIAFFLQYANNKFNVSMIINDRSINVIRKSRNMLIVESCTKVRTIRRAAKIFWVQTGFKSQKSKQKISEFQNFPNDSPREPCEDDICQVSMPSEK